MGRQDDTEHDLADDRREAILDAALAVFGRDGYRHAHTDEIARRAGISKGLLFYYYPSKERLYLRATEWFTERIEAFILTDEFRAIDDFFGRMVYVADRSAEIMCRFPELSGFYISFFSPKDSAEHTLSNSWVATQSDGALGHYFDGVRLDRFRESDGPRRAMNVLVWLTDGWLYQRLMRGEGRDQVDLAALFGEMREWCAMLRAWLYKEDCR